MAIRLIGRIFLRTRCYRYIRLIRIRAGSCSCCYVQDTTCKNIFLGYSVSCFKCLTCLRCKRGNRPLITCQVILYSDVCDCQVTIILCGDLIGNRLTKCISLAICRSRCGRLLNRDMTIRILSRLLIRSRFDRYIRLIRIRTGSGCSCLIQYLSCKNIFFCYRIACFKCFCCIRCKRCNRPGSSGQVIFHCDVRNRQITVVLDCDLICDYITQCVACFRCLTCCCLLDRQMTIRILSRIFCSTRYNRRRIIFLTCTSSCIDYRSCKDISLRYSVTCNEFHIFTGCNGLDRPLITCQVIRYDDVGQCLVTSIGCGDPIGDLLTKYIGLTICRCRRGLLRDLQLAFFTYGRLWIFTRCYRYIRFIRIRTLSCCCSNIQNLTRLAIRTKILLLYCVAGCKCLACIWCKGCNRPGIVREIIFHFNFSNRQVTVICRGDLVSDCLTKCICLTICRLGSGDLVNRQVTILLGCVNSLCSLLSNIPKDSCYSICKASCQNISLGNRISSSCRSCLTTWNICKFVLSKGYSCNFSQSNRLCLFIDVLNSDGECYCLTESIFFLFCRLCNDKFRIYRIIRLRIRIIRINRRRSCSIRHRQRTKYSLDLIVASLCSLIQCVCERVLALTYECLCTSYIIGCTFICCKSITRYGDFIICKSSSIVDLSLGSRCQCNCSLCDLKCTVFDDKGHISEISAGVLKVFCLQFHRIASGICSSYFCSSVECKVCFLIERITDLYIVTGNSLFCTIILFTSGMFFDGNSSGNRSDLLITICYVKGYFLKVLIGVCKLFCCKTHICLTGIGSCCFCSTTEGEILFCIEFITDLYIVTFYTMFSSIIVGSVFMTSDCNNHFINRCDGLVAVGYIEGDICKVLICVCKLLCCKAHIGGTFFGSCCSCFTTECEIIFCVEVVADLYIITLYTVLSSIIGGCIMMTCNGDCHIDRIDGLITIGNVEGYLLKVRIGVCKLFCRKIHFGCSNIGSCRFCITAECEILIHIVQIGICCCGISGYSMLPTIVISRIGITNNRDYNFSLRCDNKLSINDPKCYICKVLIGVCEIFCFQLHVVAACIGSADTVAATECEVCFLIKRVADLYAISGYSMLCAIILNLATVLSYGYSDINRGDDELPINNHKCYISKVLICVCEIFWLQLHIVAACFGSADTVCSGECKVFFSIELIAEFYIITGNSMRCAIVINFITVLSYGYSDIDWIDGLETIGNIESYFCEVGVGICKLFRLQAHLRCSNISSCCKCSTSKCEVLRYIIQLAICFCCITTHLMNAAIIVLSMIITNNINFNIDRCDLLITICDFKRYLSKVLIGVCELILCKTHICLTGIGSFCLCISTECEVSNRVERIADLYIITFCTMLLAIIRNTTGMTRNCNNYFINRRDSLVTISNIKGYCCKIVIGVCELIGRKTHIGSTFFGSCCFCCPTECEISFLIKRIADLYIITSNFMLFSVIC